MDVVFLGVNDVGMRIYEWLCERDGVRVLALVTTEEQLELVEQLQPEIVVSVGFDHLVPPDVLDVPPEGCVNLHPSLLPYNRGKSPNVWSIVTDTPAGVTIHYMDEAFDTGDIIVQRKVEKRFSDTGKDLHERLEVAQFKIFTDTWPMIEAREIETTPQSSEQGEYHSVEDFKELCELAHDEQHQTKELLDVLRALTFPPFDNAHIEVDGTRFFVDVDIRPADDAKDGETDGFITSY